MLSSMGIACRFYDRLSVVGGTGLIHAYMGRGAVRVADVDGMSRSTFEAAAVVQSFKGRRACSQLPLEVI